MDRPGVTDEFRVVTATVYDAVRKSLGPVLVTPTLERIGAKIVDGASHTIPHKKTVDRVERLTECCS